jgi:hypothetical protein
MEDCAARDVLADQRHGVALTRHDEGKCATKDLSSDNYDLALARLRLCRAAIDSVGRLIGGLHIATSIHAVDFDRAG